MLNKKVYKSELFMITDEFRYDMGLSLSDNIINSKHRSLGTILVEKTHSSKYVREILTGLLVPVYNIKLDYGMIPNEEEERYEFGTKSPIFIKVTNSVIWQLPYDTDLVKASKEDLIEYKKQHLIDGNYTKFLEELKVYFKEAETNFEYSLPKIEGDLKIKFKKQ